jgi:hypothetical protein
VKDARHKRLVADQTDDAGARSPGERKEALAGLQPLLENVQRDAAVMPIVVEMSAYRVSIRCSIPVGVAERVADLARGVCLRVRRRQQCRRHAGCTSKEWPT